ncbi:MAG TPA: membrane protein insertase YidC [Burkholderiales bacterium]|nr:membrane protein insertase YidC [Burkholderiales bacterium]
MDNYRLVVGIVFAVSLFLLYDAWIRDRAPVPNVAPQTQAPAAAPGPSTAVPAPIPSAVPKPAATPGSEQAAAPTMAPGHTISVKTDFLAAEIDTTGGQITRLELLQHQERADSSRPYVLFQKSPDHVYFSQSGLTGNNLPNHTTPFTAEKASYVLQQGEQNMVVTLRAQTDAAQVVKTYTFTRGSYVVDVSFTVTNRTQSAFEPYAYFQLVRDEKAPSESSKMVPTYSGVEVYTEANKLTKVGFTDISQGKATYPKSAKDGWIAIVQHYFLAAWLPPPGTQREFFMRPVGNNLVAAGVILPVGQIAAGAAATTSARLYAGPQEQDRLKVLAPGLELAVDYGWLRVLAVPLFWVLKQIHAWVGNWGVAIIVLTILIKAAFYPLSAASYRSMARMKVLAPKLQRLKERYGDDRQKMHQAMIELYKTEKINPLGGCLPIVVQIPVFIALYWVLLLSVELRQAPFFWWIKDLSAPDPLFILPVLMGATMFIQSWLNPTPPDPMQARLMKIMPIAFSVFFFFFPAGLVLYWLVNNVLSITQQWYITRGLERSKPAHGEA